MPGFYVIRHGATWANEQHLRCGGDLDIPLSVQGQKSIMALEDSLHTLRPRPLLMLVSPLIRTRQTAQIINAWLEIPTIEVEALRERLLGDWNGVGHEETSEMLASGMTPPGGEANASFRHRVMQGYREHVEPQLHLNPLLVTSAGVVRILSEAFFEQPQPRPGNGEVRWFDVEQLKNVR